MRMGWTETFEKAGVKLIDPGCGACIGAGPGVSENPEQVTVSAINRISGSFWPWKIVPCKPTHCDDQRLHWENHILVP